MEFSSVEYLSDTKSSRFMRIPRLLEGVDAFCASIRDAMVAPSFEVKQKVLQLIVQRIVVEDHRIIIEHVVPSGPIRLQPERHAPAGPPPPQGRFPNVL